MRSDLARPSAATQRRPSPPEPPAPEAPPPHALECVCPACCATLARGGDTRGHLGSGEKQAYLRRVDFSVPVQEGDHVWVEEGPYRGCLLPLLRMEGGRFVCSRTTAPYEILTRKVHLYRRRL